MICETESMLNDQDFVGLELESDFGVTNQEGDNSNPSFSTDVSDEEGDRHEFIQTRGQEGYRIHYSEHESILE